MAWSGAGCWLSRAMRRVIVVMAAQRMMASEVAGWRFMFSTSGVRAAPEIRPCEIRAPEVRVTEIGTTEVCVHERRCFEVDPERSASAKSRPLGDRKRGLDVGSDVVVRTGLDNSDPARRNVADAMRKLAADRT